VRDRGRARARRGVVQEGRGAGVRQGEPAGDDLRRPEQHSDGGQRADGGRGHLQCECGESGWQVQLQDRAGCACGAEICAQDP